MKKTVYPALDLLKLIMAVLVVAVHANPLYGIDVPFASRVLNVLESVSVPFFFVVSSFLCFYRASSCAIPRAHLGWLMPREVDDK